MTRIRQRAGVAGQRGITAAQLQHDPLDVREFVSPFDRGMRSQDLLQQR
jgi:hypothetical protein